MHGLYEIAGRVAPRGKADPTLDVVDTEGRSLGQVLVALRDEDVVISVRYAQLTRCSYCGVAVPIQGGRGHKQRTTRAVCDQPACIRAAARERKRKWRQLSRAGGPA